MKIKLNKKIAVIAAVNIVCLGGAAGFYLKGQSEARSQDYNYAAERWGTEYTQISCFIPEKSGFSVDMIGAVRTQLLNTLQTVSISAEEGRKLCPDAYSAPLGNADVKSSIGGYSDAEITVVGGDFFLIHNFTLLDGAFFSDNDIMQDGTVIDESLAWALYGSSDVAGMDITINGVKLYISGVIADPQSKAEKYCAGAIPRAYISYSGAYGISQPGEPYTGSGGYIGDGGDIAGSADVSSTFKTVTCYECIMPDPVEGYAYSTMKDYLSGLAEDAETVCNTDRFLPLKRLKALKNLRKLAVRNSSAVFPYWENASRLVEFDLSFTYRRVLWCMIIPALTLVRVIVKLFIIGRKKLRSAIDFILRRKDEIINNQRRKKYNAAGG